MRTTSVELRRVKVGGLRGVIGGNETSGCLGEGDADEAGVRWRGAE